MLRILTLPPVKSLNTHFTALLNSYAKQKDF